MNTLRQDIDQILQSSYFHKPPKSTPCWEWISKKFKEIASNYIEIVSDSIKIKIGEENYSVKIDEVEKAVGNTPFPLDEVKACIDIAEYNFIRVKVDYEPYGNTVTFTFHA